MSKQHRANNGVRSYWPRDGVVALLIVAVAAAFGAFLCAVYTNLVG